MPPSGVLKVGFMPPMVGRWTLPPLYMPPCTLFVGSPPPPGVYIVRHVGHECAQKGPEVGRMSLLAGRLEGLAFLLRKGEKGAKR